MYCRRVGTGGQPSGVVAHVVLDQPDSQAPRATLAARRRCPSLVGTGPPWLHACQEVERVFRSGEWLAVEGEPGVGKLAVLRAVQLRRQPVGTVRAPRGARGGHRHGLAPGQYDGTVLGKRRDSS